MCKCINFKLNKKPKIKTVIEINKYEKLPQVDKINIINALNYVQTGVMIQYITTQNTNKANLIEHYEDKCIFKCGYKYIYKNMKYNYKSICGFEWSPLLLHYIDKHDLIIKDDFIDFIMNFNYNLEKQKIVNANIYSGN